VEFSEVMAELERYGSEQVKKLHGKHGAPADRFGVKVGDLKKILKKTKKNQALAEALFDSGNGDAMYLATLMANEKTITPEVLRNWAEASTWSMVSEYGVAGVAAESPHGWELGLEWIGSDLEHVASAGWATLSGVVAICKDEELDLGVLEELLDRVQADIHSSSNRVRYTMNGFVIACGSYVTALLAKAEAVAKANGKVTVNMGETACKVPFAPDYLKKMTQANRIGKKRKVVRC